MNANPNNWNFYLIYAKIIINTLERGRLIMGKKIFISYKYADKEVYNGVGISSSTLSADVKARDYVTWLEEKFTKRTAHVYKGEKDNEDLSDKSKDYIWDFLKDKLYDTSITIVLISPNMKEYRRWDKSQWIPWEISYSLRKVPRNGYTSHSNAILAVILPDKSNSYAYFDKNKTFKILTDNINNGYIPVVNWDNFKYDCDKYINKALEAQKKISRDLLTINL